MFCLARALACVWVLLVCWFCWVGCWFFLWGNLISITGSFQLLTDHVSHLSGNAGKKNGHQNVLSLISYSHILENRRKQKSQVSSSKKTKQIQPKTKPTHSLVNMFQLITPCHCADCVVSSENSREAWAAQLDNWREIFSETSHLHLSRTPRPSSEKDTRGSKLDKL